NHFDGRFPRAGHKEDHSASGDSGDENEPESREEAEGERGAAAVHSETRLDVRFEFFEVRSDAAGAHAVELAVHAIEICEDGQAGCERENTDGVDDSWHGSGQAQLAAQTLFAAIHLAFVGFV